MISGYTVERFQDKEIESLYNVVDTRPPVPGMNGVITVNNPGTLTPTLSWSNAIDDYDSSNALEYLVVRNGTTNKINKSETALRNGVIQSCTPNWTANISSCTLDNQSLNTNYYYTVLARDNQGNVSSYNPVPVFFNLISYYPFNGDINDYSGNDYHLTLVNNTGDSSFDNPTYSNDRLSQTNRAFTLAGPNPDNSGSTSDGVKLNYIFPFNWLRLAIHKCQYRFIYQYMWKWHGLSDTDPNYSIALWVRASSTSTTSSTVLFLDQP